MRKRFTQKLKHVLCYALVATVAITFIPLNTTQVSAASFSTTGQVKNVRVVDTSYDTVKLKWDKYAGATEYKIFSSSKEDTGYKLRATTKKTSYRIYAPTNHTRYYKVKAYRVTKSGNVKKGKSSDAISAVARLDSPELSLKTTSEDVQLTWTGVDGATGYKVYRCNTEDGEYKTLGATKKHYFKNVKLELGKIYYYKVAAYREVNGKRYFGPNSEIMRGITTRPAPSEIEAVAECKGIKITFSKVSKVSGYAVYRATSKDGPYDKLGYVTKRKYYDKSIKKDQKYYYKVRGYINLNDKKYYGKASPIASRTYSLAPVVLKTAPKASSVKLTWTAVDGVTGYQIFRATSKNGDYKKLASTSKTSFYNTSVKERKKYYYKVRPYKKTSSKTIYGPYCKAKSGSTLHFRTGSRVKHLEAETLNTETIELNWNKFEAATGYKIYRAYSKNGNYTRIAKTADTTYRISVKMNKSYYFKVKAYVKDETGAVKNSRFSYSVKGRATLDQPALTMTPYAEKLRLDWNNVPEATGYTLYRATDEDGDYTELCTTNKHAFINTTIKKGNMYYYKVYAYKTVDGKKYYGPGSDVKKGVTLRPAPSNVKVVAEGTGLKIRFNTVKNATGYIIYRSDSKTGTYSRIASVGTNEYFDRAIVKEKRYYYKVCAYVDLNSYVYYGTESDIASGRYMMSLTTLSITPKASAVQLKWTAVDGAKGYQIYRATKRDGDYTKLSNASGTKFKNTSVEEDTFYYYKVRAYKKSGSKTIYGPFCEPMAGVTKLKAPDDVKGRAKASGIRLTWDKVKNAKGYEVYRATSQNGKYTKMFSTTKTSYTNTKSLTLKQKYYYKVRGYRTLNGKKVYGQYSALSASRDAVVKVAVGWYGCRESNGSHKKIIDVYNSNLAPGCGKLSYYVPWCAAFVSAVGIKAKATKIIVRHSYCPTMLNTYRNKDQYSGSKYYSPKPGDIIFYDWNRNNCPDHVGMIVSCKGDTVTAIEGNKNDAVEYREFSKGYTYVQGYGLPAYGNTSGITYTGEDSTTVAKDELEAAGISTNGNPKGYSDMGSEYNKAERDLSVGCGEDATEMEQMKVIIKTMKQNAKTSNLKSSSKSEYLAAFLYRLCKDAAIEACIVNTTNDKGEKVSYVEVTLDGKLYRVDPMQKNCKPVRYKPEVTDYNGD